MPRYIVSSAAIRPALSDYGDGPVWNQAEVLELIHFRHEGSSHRPKTEVRLLYCKEGISGLFKVDDQYIKSVHTQYMAPVCRDSCVEFFVQPKPGKGYFNFEFNCGGFIHCSYITDPTRTGKGFRDFTQLSEDDGRQIHVSHSMPRVVEPEITQPETWFLSFFVPFSLLEKYVGSLGAISGQSWRANFYKCGDETSHPHWASWAPIPAKNFHQPEYFGMLSFQ